jgi:DNA-damage-inducible protein J
MAANPVVQSQHPPATSEEVSDFAGKMGMTLQEATRALERKAADPDSLSFMPDPKDLVSEEAYNGWLRAKVQQALDDPRPTLSSEEVEAHFAQRKAAILAKAQK